MTASLERKNIMTAAYVGSAIILIVITWLSLWVTNKAYSRKWEE